MSVVDRRIQRHVRLSTFFWWCHNYRCLHSRSYQSAANRLNKWWLPTPLYRTEWKDIWISQALTELPLQTINWWSNWHHAVMAVGSGWLLCTRTWSNFDVCRVYCVSVCNVHDVWGVVMLVSQVRRLSGLSRKHTLAHMARPLTAWPPPTIRLPTTCPFTVAECWDSVHDVGSLGHWVHAYHEWCLSLQARS